MRTGGARLAGIAAVVASLAADVAHAGPITFLTTLPVAQGQAVVRRQYL